MIDWQQFHFLRPAWFTLLAPLAVLLWYLLRRRGSSRGWEVVCDPALLPHVLIGDRSAAGWRPVWPVAVAGVLATLALAGPTWSRLPQPVFSSTQALVIALDLSRSMNAVDVAPSRIERARFKIADLLRLRRDGQTALLVYAGDSFIVAPLTDDAATLMSQLPALTPAIMPVPGNHAAVALAQARDLLRQGGLARGDVLLITDEVEGEAAMDQAAALRDDGYRVSVLGVGTEQGAPVPLPDGSFLKDDGGEIVIPALDDARLRDLAAAGGGIYQRIAVDDADINTLASLLEQSVGTDARATELEADVWRDQGPWLVLALLPLAAIAFRRGLVLALVLTLLPLPRPAHAMEWADFWLRPDQQGKRAFDQGDAARAAELFADPRWRGAARYQAGDFPGALEALAEHKDEESLYNRGNALARLGRFPEAVAAYDQALALQPDHGDAKFNRDLVQKQMQAPPQSRQQSGDQQSGDQAAAGNGPSGSNDAKGQDQPSPGDQESRSGSGAKDQPPQADAGQSPGDSSSGPMTAGKNSAAEGAKSTGAGPQRDDAGSEPKSDVEKPVTVYGADDSGSERQQEPAQATGAVPQTPIGEDQQALEQWLRRIPDDPGGLLRRKFQYQYQLRRAQTGAEPSGGKTW